MCAGKDGAVDGGVRYRAGECHRGAGGGTAHMLAQFWRSMEGVRVAAGPWRVSGLPFANTETTNHPIVGNDKIVYGV